MMLIAFVIFKWYLILSLDVRGEGKVTKLPSMNVLARPLAAFIDAQIAQTGLLQCLGTM